MPKRKLLSDILREKIRSCGLSANRLSKKLGDVSQPTITVFLNGGDLRLRTAERLMEYFGVTVNS